jgi:hypothetical protein
MTPKSSGGNDTKVTWLSRLLLNIQMKRNLVSSVIGGDSQEPEVVAGNYK